MAAKVLVASDRNLGEVADLIDDAEAGVRAAVPAAPVIYVERDVARTPAR